MDFSNARWGYLCRHLLHGIESKLSKRQRNFSTEPAQKRTKMDSPKPGIMDLPDEVLETIFLMLPQHDTHQGVALVCKRFLNITRRPNFVQIAKIELIAPSKDEILYWPCIMKIEKVKKVYPDCKIELACRKIILLEWENDNDDDYYDEDEGDYSRELPNISWIERFLPYATSITKLTLKVEQDGCWSQFQRLLCLNNLEYLDISIFQYSWQCQSIQCLGHELWSKFSNLKSLRIQSDHDYRWVRILFYSKFFQIISTIYSFSFCFAVNS